jgi:hypothetical protein
MPRIAKAQNCFMNLSLLCLVSGPFSLDCIAAVFIVIQPPPFRFPCALLLHAMGCGCDEGAAGINHSDQSELGRNASEAQAADPAPGIQSAIHNPGSSSMSVKGLRMATRFWAIDLCTLRTSRCFQSAVPTMMLLTIFLSLSRTSLHYLW